MDYTADEKKQLTANESKSNSSECARLSKRILPKRRAKSMVPGYDKDLYDLASPPRKRNRTVLQQTELLPNFNSNIHLNKLGFEDEDEDEEDSENLPKKFLRPSRISLPVPATSGTASSGRSKRRISYASETLDRKKLRTQSCNDKITNKNCYGKNKSGKLVAKNGNVENDLKRMEDELKCSEQNLRKPMIKLKRVDAMLGARSENDEFDEGSEPGSEGSKKDSDFEPSGAEQNSDDEADLISDASFCADNSETKRKKVTRQTQSNQKTKNQKKQFAEERKTSSKYNKCGIIANVFPKLKLSAQRVETLETVYRRLHTSEIPERLPCREAEYERICTFIKECVVGSDAISQAMYVSGVPGTGKTATVLQAVRYLKASKKFSKFDFVMVNAMELADPKQIFVEIYLQLMKPAKEIAPKTARKKLNDMFQYRDRKRLPIILLIDELDLLNTKKQEVIYDVFNWSANEESLVSVIAIANTLDLPERLLSQRISSRLGTNRLCFQPYDHEEVAYIIRDRLRGSTAVETEAVELASRKVAAVSGDLRKALDILRSATQLAISSNQKQLTMKNVQEAIRQASTNVRVELIRALSLHSVLLLRAAIAEQMSTGLDEFHFHTLLKQYRLQCRVANKDPMPTSSAYRNAMEMCSARLLIAAPGHGCLTRRFSLGMTAHDVQFAFKQLDESVF